MSKVASTLLLLGGTADGRRLASRLHAQGVAVIYSVAGLVRRPEVACEIVSGGFSQFGGLEMFIRQRGIGAILNATHPYAETMSLTAARVAESLAIPCWRFLRPAWQPQPGDQWQQFASWEALLPALRGFSSVLLSAGQLEQQVVRGLDHLGQRFGQSQVLRTAVPPPHPLPLSMLWIKAIGPFALADERRLIHNYGIDVIVSKNSGGDATSAKLQVARERGLPVLMLARPASASASAVVQVLDCPDQCIEQVLYWHRSLDISNRPSDSTDIS